MRSLPPAIVHLLCHFEVLFGERTWEWAKTLLIGAILAPGKRTVTACLRVLGLSHAQQFQTFHRVQNRGTWSSRNVSRVLLKLVLQAFVPPDAPVILGIDEHLERRRGPKIAAKGIYRAPVHSSRSFFGKARGLRGVSLMLLTPVPWAKRMWALPFLTALAPSERYYLERTQRHTPVLTWVTPDSDASAALGTRAKARCGCRQYVCGARLLGCLSRVEQASHRHHALAA